MPSTTTLPPTAVTAAQAHAVAEADALQTYRNLSPFRVELRLESDGWHVDYEIVNPRLQGGGPHYIIAADTGAIVHKRYEQ